MHKLWRWNLHGHISLLPFTLLYAVFCFVVYGARSWGLRRGVVICVGERLGRMFPGTGAQTIGGCTIYANTTEELREDLHVHENCHVVQAQAAALLGQVVVPLAFAAIDWPIPIGCAIGGPVGALGYSLVYGFCFLGAWTIRGFGPWRDAYHANPFEVQAYRRQTTWLHSMTAEQRKAVWS